MKFFVYQTIKLSTSKTLFWFWKHTKVSTQLLILTIHKKRKRCTMSLQQRTLSGFCSKYSKSPLNRHCSFNAVFWDSEKGIKGKPRYRRTILVLEWENGTFSEVHFLSKVIYKHKSQRTYILLTTRVLTRILTFMKSDKIQAKLNAFAEVIKILQWNVKHIRKKIVKIVFDSWQFFLLFFLKKLS